MSDKEEVDSELEYLLGIDEAGRGPVLGSMVYGTCWCPIKEKEVLAKMGFADSKQLTEAQREKLFVDIKDSDILKWAVDVISPISMSANMLKRKKYNLNAISHDSAMGLIQRALDEGYNIQEVYVDTVGKPETYQEKLQYAFPGIRKITVEKKADSLFPIVSAASICAKVTRDHDLIDWVFCEEGSGSDIQMGRAFGCGYPGDNITKTWLQDHFNRVFGFPKLVRFSWSTSEKIIKERGVQFDWDDESDDEEEGENRPSKMQKMTMFLQSQNHSAHDTAQRIPMKKRATYFKRLNMHVCSGFNDYNTP